MCTTTIKPTVGRIVLVFFAPDACRAMDDYALPTTADTPVPGLVVRVRDDGLINVAAFDVHGTNLPLTNVRLLQDGDERPTSGCWAEWMPHQKQRTEKHEATLPAAHPVQQLADAIGGTIEHLERLPDGTGAAVMSMPLPTNHWLTQPGYNVPPMKFRLGTLNPCRKQWVEDITAAGRYAVRCATMNGAENDFDPDALVQNLVVGMLGYFTPDGLSSDADANPPAAAA